MTNFVAKGHTGTVSFDGSFVTITRSGMTRLTVGKGEKRIPLGSISGVEFKPAGALVNGFIQFTIPGGVERRSRAGSRTVDAGRDENSVLFTRKEQPAFDELRRLIEAAMVQRAAPMTAGPSSVADELAKLARLVEQGLLSRQEFDVQKARLLGR